MLTILRCSSHQAESSFYTSTLISLSFLSPITKAFFSVYKNHSNSLILQRCERVTYVCFHLENSIISRKAQNIQHSQNVRLSKFIKFTKFTNSTQFEISQKIHRIREIHLLCENHGIPPIHKFIKFTNFINFVTNDTFLVIFKHHAFLYLIDVSHDNLRIDS